MRGQKGLPVDRFFCHLTANISKTVESYLNKKLSDRKQIAHKLCTQYVDGIYMVDQVKRRQLTFLLVTSERIYRIK